MLSLNSDPKFFSAVRGTVERLTETLGFSATECRSITRAVDEALTNVARHSYNNRLDRPIKVSFQMAQRRSAGEVQQGLEVILSDRGPKIDTSKLSGRPLDVIRPGGLGLHFIRDAMDIVEFKRQGATNRLRLVKYLAGAKNAL